MSGRSTVRYRPEESPWPGRNWEAKCWRPSCVDAHGWTWHMSWWNAMGRAWHHLREAHS